jgi:hypothetical protein
LFEKFFTKKSSIEKKTRAFIENIVHNIDAVFQHPNAKFPYPVIVYHGLDYKKYDKEKFNHKVGDIIEYKGYMSTSLNPNTAMSFSYCNRCCIYKIHIGKNSNIIPLVWFYGYNNKKISIDRIIKNSFDMEAGLQTEEEFLIHRNSKIQVIDIYEVEPSLQTTVCEFGKIKNPSLHRMKVFECVLLFS